MSFDPSGYRDRWVVQCTDLFGQQRRVILVPAADGRSILLITPTDTLRLSAASAHELAQDLRETAQHTKERP